ncbi:6,7-dimethyl-8-ribityllumazine synthase [Lichenihabitans psoromatis]|uniref:6,7-dimethyl-8-ribityllumazine synthase n=1 Tax=Lichenihabitans psoromatis TaxID=2528642 RepID=UPI0010364300|nr:6,7-dimethyl-8-ribityllumazine synthase [Lichenihabitans psoromatis]
MAEPSRILPDTVETVAPAHILIAEARFYDAIGTALLAGAVAAVTAAGATYDVISLPGALEIPIAVAICVDAAYGNERAYDAVVVLGCVMRGETYHFEIVSNESSRGIMAVALTRRLPLGNGILTVENEEQAMERADPARGDKGGDAARAALALLRLQRKVEAK